MLILHVAMSEGDPGLAWVWAETGATDQQQRQGKSRRKWGVGAREHPCACGDILHSVLPEELLSVGVWQRRTAWLPTDSEGPLPSHERIAPQSGRRAERLAPWAVSALAINPGALHTLFVGCRGKEPADWQFGEDAASWRHVHELAGKLVVRQQFLPAVLYADGSWFATWYPIYEAEDRKQIEWLAEGMPLAARALNWDPRRPPAVSPGWAVTSAIVRIVDSIAKAGANLHATRAGRPPAGDSWKEVPLHQRWVESLLSPGTELRGRVRELTEFELQIEAWREPLLRTSKWVGG